MFVVLSLSTLGGCGTSPEEAVDNIEAELLKMSEIMGVPPYHLSDSDIDYVVSLARAEGWGSVRPKAGRVEIFAKDRYFCLHLPRDTGSERVLYEAPC